MNYEICPECLGDGEVEYEYIVYNLAGPNELDTKIQTCDRCQGTGRVEAEEVDF